jgi:hypothetical protein
MNILIIANIKFDFIFIKHQKNHKVFKGYLSNNKEKFLGDKISTPEEHLSHFG